MKHMTYSYICMSSPSISYDTEIEEYPSFECIHLECKKAVTIFMEAIEMKDIDFIVYLSVSIQKMKHVPNYIPIIYNYLTIYFKSPYFIHLIYPLLTLKEKEILMNVVLELYEIAYILE